MIEFVLLVSLLTLALSVAAAALARGACRLVLRSIHRRRTARQAREMPHAFVARSQPSHPAG